MAFFLLKYALCCATFFNLARELVAISPRNLICSQDGVSGFYFHS